MLVTQQRIRFQGKAGTLEEELAKTSLAPETEKRLEDIAQRNNLNSVQVKNLYKQERALLNLLSKNMNKQPISDEELLKEFEARDWQEKIGPRR